MHSNDLSLLEETLIELSKLNIKGIFFYDIGVLNIVKRLNLNIPLVWAQEHMTTNYETINFWYNEGAESTQVSEEIKDVLLKSNLTNLRFVALNEWEYSDRILERSVRRRLEKGSIYPELIEAWLKYGVITEDDLR